MNDYQVCAYLHRSRLKDWMLIPQKKCVCEFVKVSHPIGIDILRISKNDSTYSYSHFQQYYRGFEPRLLEQKKHLVERKCDFQSLESLFNFVEDKSGPSFEPVRFEF